MATLAVAVVIVITGVMLLGAQRRVLNEQLDEALAADADRLVADVVSPPAPAVTELDPGGDDDAIAQLTTIEGAELARSPNLVIGSAVGVVPTRNGDSYTVEEDLGPDAERYRVISRRFAGPNGEDLVVHVGAPRDDIEDALRSLVTALRFGVPAVTVILGLLIWMMVGRTLRPVERIRTEVAAIGPAELGRRVPAPPGDDELPAPHARARTL